MARTLEDCFIEIDGTEITTESNKAVVKMENEEHDSTGYGADFKQTEPGLGDASIELELFQAFGEGSVNSLLAEIFAEKKAVTVVVRPGRGEVSASNPGFELKEGKLFGREPIAGAGPGQLMMTPANFKNVGSEGIVEVTE